MHSDQSGQPLRDILENARPARSFIIGSDEATFAAHVRTVYGVTRCLELISEASRRLDQSIRDRHPALPWRAIMGAGNVYLHDYDNVAEDQVWRAVNKSLVTLIDIIAHGLGEPLGGHA
jgi:uncharacterized protein with HEPN domain